MVATGKTFHAIINQHHGREIQHSSWYGNYINLQQTDYNTCVNHNLVLQKFVFIILMVQLHQANTQKGINIVLVDFKNLLTKEYYIKALPQWHKN